MCTVRTSNVRRLGLSHPPHHHAACDRCDQITEVPMADLAAVIPTLTEASGQDLDDGHLLITGRCPACAHR